MTEGLHPQHSVPSRMACRCIGVSKKTHHRLQQIEVDIGAQLRPGQWIVALKIIWFVSGISKDSKVIQSIKLVFAEYFAHIKCDLKSAESGRICECCFWETLDTKDCSQIWWNSGSLSFDACTSPACSPFTVSDRSFMGRSGMQLNNEYVKPGTEIETLKSQHAGKMLHKCACCNRLIGFE